MSRSNGFWLAGGLAIAGVVFLVWGIALLGNNIRSHVADRYQEYSRDAGGSRYVCDGSPQRVADELAAFKAPEARATDRGTTYLRYDDDIVSVGPDANHPCSIRVEDTNARYRHGGFIYLGPGFTPGSPAGGAGGSSGGPGGAK
ncbi:hypothetical protein BA059_25040 [Mycolicibacterium sp. (ex Dasyatis americana)]|uniref:DUF4247 domain-containing protein n=1 Tax=Mycobacterium syngnathidarum TaxID=1908205 RepID=A0A1Q9W2U6_9MYCO|nr:MULTISPECIES: DUF4247 domain-containing protein [Mycobacterium]OFB36342.1 hypothetical protein BA059_25040 [Mycolicibacterium sp. (ex Dasyatis americana)]MCG7609248.1 DUF4247 domain-containing protein [Mycobacterium sp. CnD-18-1]OHT99003.1 hypothetical protein BKG61_14130 [Mycobacterium syngnathidarum]OLT87614.1 hypothetical protein BKG60_28525 [Mycobacterium syngnathidarum]TMS47481.1 DUF4247 domain-containing protein [Mycobacterium sp. DBP42]